MADIHRVLLLWAVSADLHDFELNRKDMSSHLDWLENKRPVIRCNMFRLFDLGADERYLLLDLLVLWLLSERKCRLLRNELVHLLRVGFEIRDLAEEYLPGLVSADV